MDQLILASSSPRRHQLLAEAGYVFETVIPAVDETQLPSETASVFALRIAEEKALRVVRERAITVAADTIVVYAGQAMGKPRDATQAVAMLRLLSGEPHEVMTGWALASTTGIVSSGVETTHVTFRKLSANEIDSYVAGGEPLDRAGAYAIQGGAGRFVAAIDGSYSNVMGLPMETVTVALALAGVEPMDGPAP